MALRPCLGTPDQHCTRLVPGNRCPDHARVVEGARTRRKRAVRPYTSQEQARRAAAVATHRATRGDWCPGWGVPAHAATDLTADHVRAVGAGGAEEGPLSVLCRPCNGRKGSD